MKSRTSRDEQQWMLDLALNMRGRVQNFERDETEVPKGTRARNYRMLPKLWRQAGARHERLALNAMSNGSAATATQHFDHAIEAFRSAQHAIFFDDHPVKIQLHEKLNELTDLRSQTASYPIERVEVEFDDGKTISCLLHLLPDKRRAPVVIYIPGMDQTKEIFPKASDNLGISRGFHVLAMDGPGQGSSNMKKIRAVGDNYERAGAAVISYLLSRPEVDSEKIGLYGVSMGGYWALRLASHDPRAAVVVASGVALNPNNALFNQSSPRFKQMFMYMAGYTDETRFDREVAENMTTKGYLSKIECPTLMATGEYDPLSPIEEALAAFEELTVPKQWWIFENQFHPLRSLSNLGGMDNHNYVCDWLQQFFSGKSKISTRGNISYIREGGDGPWADCEWTPTINCDQTYF